MQTLWTVPNADSILLIIDIMIVTAMPYVLLIFAVIFAQYLPTLLLDAGRHQTQAIKLVTSFGGMDRRVKEFLDQHELTHLPTEKKYLEWVLQKRYLFFA